jgi:F0F1-type ATP synthase alpha subunit
MSYTLLFQQVQMIPTLQYIAPYLGAALAEYLCVQRKGDISYL